jgi:hypothetical protein
MARPGLPIVSAGFGCGCCADLRLQQQVLLYVAKGCAGSSGLLVSLRCGTTSFEKRYRMPCRTVTSVP